MTLFKSIIVHTIWLALNKLSHTHTVSLFLHSLTFVPLKPQISRYLRKADLIIANSRSLQQKLTSRFPHVAKNIRIVELGVDLSVPLKHSSLRNKTVEKNINLGMPSPSFL